MRNLNGTIQKFFLVTMTVALISLYVTTAWATFAFFNTKDGSAVGTQQEDTLASASFETPRSRAPEPSTIALLGSGILGMIASFIRRTYQTMKRIFDMIAAILGIVLLSPLYLLTILLVKLTSPGPIFYNQTRVGKDGKLFEMYKFRSMRIDAEKETGPVWAAANDDRLTPIGNFLRKSHIDEIPQFFNILKGDMSLIGPRPERPCFVEKFKTVIPDYEKRLAVTPGITGLAQVWHKYDETIEDVKRKIKYDLLYIKKFCLWTDLRIFFRTFRVVFTGEGAR